MHWDGWVTSRNMPRATLVSSAAEVLTPTCRRVGRNKDVGMVKRAQRGFKINENFFMYFQPPVPDTHKQAYVLCLRIMVMNFNYSKEIKVFFILQWPQEDTNSLKMDIS